MKRTLAFLGAVILSFCLFSCNNQNENLSNDEQNNALKREQLTTEEDLWKYIEALYVDFDIVNASKYSFFDVEKIYQEVIVKTCEQLNISQEELYVNIQSRMNNSKITDYISFSKAFTDFKNTNEPINKTEARNGLAEYKIIHRSASLNDSEIINFKKFVFRCCDDLIENRSIDITKFITFSDVTEYKKITIEEPVPETEAYDEVQGHVDVPQGATTVYYIVKTSTGWKVVDFNIVRSLQVITEDIWNVYN